MSKSKFSWPRALVFGLSATAPWLIPQDIYGIPVDWGAAAWLMVSMLWYERSETR